MTTATAAFPLEHSAQPDAVAGRLTAAGLLAVSGAIHLAVAPEHLRGWWAAGVFFTALAAFQLALAGSLLGRARPITLLLTLGSTVGVIITYVWSRTVGLPFAPATVHEHAVAGHEGHAVGGIGTGVPVFPDARPASSVEPVGTLDLAALGAELLLVLVVVALLPARLRGRVSTGLLAIGLALIVWRALGSPA